MQALGRRKAVPPQKLDGSWADLPANSDAKAAFQAMGEMISQPRETTATLAELLQPVPQVDMAMVDQLGTRPADSDNFTKRQKATKDLEKLDAQARPALEKVVANPHRRKHEAGLKLAGPPRRPGVVTRGSSGHSSRGSFRKNW